MEKERPKKTPEKALVKREPRFGQEDKSGRPLSPVEQMYDRSFTNFLEDQIRHEVMCNCQSCKGQARLHAAERVFSVYPPLVNQVVKLFENSVAKERQIKREDEGKAK